MARILDTPLIAGVCTHPVVMSSVLESMIRTDILSNGQRLHTGSVACCSEGSCDPKGQEEVATTAPV